MRTVIPSEAQARALDFCPACGVEKSFDGLVCWDCFKRSEAFEPLKYSGKGFVEWYEGLPGNIELEKRLGDALRVMCPICGRYTGDGPCNFNHGGGQ